MNKWLRLFDFNSYFSGSAAAYAMAGAAVVGAGASIYGSAQQKQAIEEQEAIQAQAMEDAKVQEQAMFAQRAIDAENQGNATVEFGAPDDDEEAGTYDDFISPTAIASNTGLGVGGNSSGLGFGTV